MLLSQPRVAAAESVSGFKEVHASPYFKPHTVILHPGEVRLEHMHALREGCRFFFPRVCYVVAACCVCLAVCYVVVVRGMYTHAAACLRIEELQHCVPQVNKIRELPQHPNIVITHTDAPELFVWSTDQQPNRASEQKVRMQCVHSAYTVRTQYA